MERSSSLTMARATRPDRGRRRRGRTSCAIRTKGNGATVKTGIRRSQGEFVLHRRACAVRCAPPRAATRRVRPGHRCAQGTDAGDCRPAVRQSAVERPGQPSHRTSVTDLTSGFAVRREHLREFLHLLPNGFSTPTTTTLAFIKAGYNVAFEPVDARGRASDSRRSDSRGMAPGSS